MQLIYGNQHLKEGVSGVRREIRYHTCDTHIKTPVLIGVVFDASDCLSETGSPVLIRWTVCADRGGTTPDRPMRLKKYQFMSWDT